MALGRGIRVFHSPGQTPYSVLVEQRGEEQYLLLQSQAIVAIGEHNKDLRKDRNVPNTGGEEGDNLKSSLVKLCDAYGVLGNLRYSSPQGVLHYLVLVTGTVSVGKLDSSEVSAVRVMSA